MSENEYFYSSVPHWEMPNGPADIQVSPQNYGVVNGGFGPIHPGLPPPGTVTPVQRCGILHPQCVLQGNPEHWPLVGGLITHAADLIGSSNGWYGLGVLALGAGGVLYLLHGSGQFKKPVNIPVVDKKVKPVYLAGGLFGLILLGSYMSHQSLALAGKGGGGYGGGGGGGTGGSGYNGTPGWYTISGHHHCTAHSAGCACTDPGKCAGVKGTGGPYCKANPGICLPKAPGTCFAYYPGDVKYCHYCPAGTGFRNCGGGGGGGGGAAAGGGGKGGKGGGAGAAGG